MSISSTSILGHPTNLDRHNHDEDAHGHAEEYPHNRIPPPRSGVLMDYEFLSTAFCTSAESRYARTWHPYISTWAVGRIRERSMIEHTSTIVFVESKRITQAYR